MDAEPGASPSPSATSSAASGEASLRFAVYGNREVVKVYQDLAEAFTENNPQVTIEVEQADDRSQARQQLERSFEQSDPPDVFLADRDHLPALVNDERIQPVDVLLEERGVDFGDGYQRDGLAALSAESALQCMPNNVSPLVVYYNEDLLDFSWLVEQGDDEPVTARDGWTWEQFSVAARRIARGQVKGVYLEPDLETLAPFVWSAGGDLVDDLEVPTSLTLSSSDSLGALEEVLSLVRDPEVTPSRQELKSTDAVTRFQQGRLGMILGTRALTPKLRETANLDFDVLPIPSLGIPRTTSEITGYCISSQTEHVDAAADFIAFAVGRKGAAITSESGHIVPSNVKVAHSPAFTQPNRQPENAFLFTEGVRRADETPFVAQWPEVVQDTRPMIERMFYATVIDLEALLTRIDARSQVILAPVQEQAEQAAEEEAEEER